MSKLPIYDHYKAIEAISGVFSVSLGIPNIADFLSTAGDKCYSYKAKWNKNGISFHYGVMIYMLTYIFPYSSQVRETEKGWVDVSTWVIDNFKNNSNITKAVKLCELAIVSLNYINFNDTFVPRYKH
jgi:hypothetical protein